MLNGAHTALRPNKWNDAAAMQLDQGHVTSWTDKKGSSISCSVCALKMLTAEGAHVGSSSMHVEKWTIALLNSLAAKARLPSSFSSTALTCAS